MLVNSCTVNMCLLTWCNFKKLRTWKIPFILGLVFCSVLSSGTFKGEMRFEEQLFNSLHATFALQQIGYVFTSYSHNVNKMYVLVLGDSIFNTKLCTLAFWQNVYSFCEEWMCPVILYWLPLNIMLCYVEYVNLTGTVQTRLWLEAG